MSDSNNEVEHYDWKSAWKLDDSEWVKERKKKWREIKNHEIMYIYGREDMKFLRNFFLTGSALTVEELDEYSYDADKDPIPVKASLLIQIWFHPCIDLQGFQYFKLNAPDSSISESRFRFLEGLRKYYPKEGGLFLDRDSVIYRILGPCRARHNDIAPNLSTEDYNQKCLQRIYALEPPITSFLTETYSESNLAPDLVMELKDVIPQALKLACEKGGSSRATAISCFVDLVKPSIKIIKSPDKYHSKQLEVAQEIIGHLKTLEYPDKTKRLTDLLAKV